MDNWEEGNEQNDLYVSLVYLSRSRTDITIRTVGFGFIFLTDSVAELVIDKNVCVMRMYTSHLEC